GPGGRAGPADEVRLPGRHGDIAVLVEEADVAARGPPFCVEGLAGELGIGVAGAQIGTPTPDLARLPRWDAAAAGVDQPELDAGQRAAIGTLPRRTRRVVQASPG